MNQIAFEMIIIALTGVLSIFTTFVLFLVPTFIMTLIFKKNIFKVLKEKPKDPADLSKKESWIAAISGFFFSFLGAITVKYYFRIKKKDEDKATKKAFLGMFVAVLIAVIYGIVYYNFLYEEPVREFPEEYRDTIGYAPEYNFEIED